MKRIFFCLFLAFALTCLFALGVCAEEIRLETDSLDEIKSAIDSSVAGDSIIIDMTGDILIPNQASAIKIEKDITVTVNFNGYLLFNNGGGGSAGYAYGILLNSLYAKLIMNGNTTVDYLNYVEPSDARITVSKGEIVNPNKEAGVQSPDYASDGPAIVVYNGSVELYNTYIRQYNTGEWGIFFIPNSKSEKIVNNIKAEDSIVRCPSSRYAALGTRQGSSKTTESLVEIERCVIYGTSSSEWISMGADSYIRNTRIALNSFKIDSYMADGYARDGHEAVLQNVIFENPSVSSNTGAIYVKMIDCKFPNGMSLYITGDSQGKTKFTVIESPTCEGTGGVYYAEFSKGSGKTFTSFKDFPTVLEEYDPLGHDNQKLVKYENGYLNEGYKRDGCTRCTLYTYEVLPSIFTLLGYSMPESGERAISIGFLVNNAALSAFTEETGKTLRFGAFFASQARLGDNDIFDVDCNAADGVITSELDTSCRVFYVKVSGFLTEAQTSAKLSLGAYAITEDGDTWELSYMQYGTLEDGAKYCFMSYNDYAAL